MSEIKGTTLRQNTQKSCECQVPQCEMFRSKFNAADIWYAINYVDWVEAIRKTGNYS